MASFLAKLNRYLTSAYVRRLDVENVDVEATRSRWSLLTKAMPAARGVAVRPDTFAGMKSEWYTPEDRVRGRVMLYLHGGGYVIGGCDMHRQFVSHLALAGRIEAVLPEYRLAPEHKYPAAVEDCVRAYRTLLADGVSAHDIVIAGDSAGGGLTAATLIALRDADDPLPAAAVMLSPFLDVTASGESMRTRAAQDPWFKPESVKIIADYYCTPDQQREPLVSPVFADVAGLPPIYIQVGDDEILLSDSERFAANLRAAGCEVKLEVWPEMWHVFQLFVDKMPESRQAIDKLGAHIQGVFPA